MSNGNAAPLNLIPRDIQWEISKAVLDHIRGLLPAQALNCYSEMVYGLRLNICNYINAHNRCDQDTQSISPMGGSEEGGKIVKFRVAIPGGGKSGGLRITVDMHCDERRIRVTHGELRKNLPPGKG